MIKPKMTLVGGNINQLRAHIRKEKRNFTWTIQMFLSMIVLCAMSESFPPSDMNIKESFAYAVSVLSVALSMMMSIMYYVKRSKKLVGGTIFELVGATLLLGLWIGATVIIQDPKNDIASTIDLSTGVEFVDEANLYFFTWFALFSNVYLVASFFHDVTTINFRMLGWISVLLTSLILLGISRHLTEDICDADDGVMCYRIKYASVASGAASFIAFVASVLTYQSKMSSRTGLMLASPNALVYPFGAGESIVQHYIAILFYASIILIIYFMTDSIYNTPRTQQNILVPIWLFGYLVNAPQLLSFLALLTSSDGPGRTLGTLYFMIWIGSIISVLLLIGEFNGMFLDKEDMRETIVSDSQQGSDGEVQTKDNTPIISVESIIESLHAESSESYELEKGEFIPFATPVTSPVAKKIDSVNTEILESGTESSDVEVYTIYHNISKR